MGAQSLRTQPNPNPPTQWLGGGTPRESNVKNTNVVAASLNCQISKGGSLTSVGVGNNLRHTVDSQAPEPDSEVRVRAQDVMIATQKLRPWKIGRAGQMAAGALVLLGASQVQQLDFPCPIPTPEA